jgi:hypothetical protein
MCPPPPAENCCTRLVERPAATLRVRFADREERAISSVTLWDAFGGALGASPAHLSGAIISIGSAERSMTGCFLASSSAAPPPGGFHGKDVVCGATGDTVVMSFPGVLAVGQGKLAVKLCTVPAEMAGNSKLWIKTQT